MVIVALIFATAMSRTTLETITSEVATGRWPQCGYNHCTCGHLPQQHSPASLCLVEILKRRGVEFEWPLGHFRRVRLTRYHVVSQT